MLPLHTTHRFGTRVNKSTPPAKPLSATMIAASRFTVSASTRMHISQLPFPRRFSLHLTLYSGLWNPVLAEQCRFMVGWTFVAATQCAQPAFLQRFRRHSFRIIHAAHTFPIPFLRALLSMPITGLLPIFTSIIAAIPQWESKHFPLKLFSFCGIQVYALNTAWLH